MGRSLLLAGMMLAAPAFAQQPTFPLLQDGGARSAFVGGTYRTCFEKQRAENGTLSAPMVGAFCLCYGRSMADTINGAEYEALATGKLPDSFVEKGRVASNICIARMAQQGSEERRLRVAVENRCRSEYHPEDTDFAAAQVRSPRDAMDYCSQRL